MDRLNQIQRARVERLRGELESNPGLSRGNGNNWSHRWATELLEVVDELAPPPKSKAEILFRTLYPLETWNESVRITWEGTLARFEEALKAEGYTL